MGTYSFKIGLHIFCVSCDFVPSLFPCFAWIALFSGMKLKGWCFQRNLMYMFFSCLETNWSILEFSEQPTALGRRGILETRT